MATPAEEQKINPKTASKKAEKPSAATPVPAASVPPPAAVAAATEEKGFTVCPRCGWSVLFEGKPTEDDVREYVRASWGGRKYEKAFTLYGGTLRAVFHTLTDTEIQDMNSTLRMLAELTDIKEDRRSELCLKLKTAYYLRDVTVDGVADKLSFTPTPNMTVEEVDNMFKVVTEPVSMSLVQLLLTFLDYQKRLIGAGFDDSFWQGAGLV